MDGWRCLARVDDGRLRLTSRWRNDLTTMFVQLGKPPQGLADDRVHARPMMAVTASGPSTRVTRVFGKKHWVSSVRPIRAPAMRPKITSAAKSKPVRRLPTVIL